MHPELIKEAFIYGLDVGRPFEPVEVGTNDEVPIQLVGTYRDCRSCFDRYQRHG